MPKQMQGLTSNEGERMNESEYIVTNKAEFLKYLKSRFPLVHDSNVFLRDLHYGLMSYVEEVLNNKLRYLDAEKIAYAVAAELEKQGIFKKIDSRTWLLNYPEFALPRVAPPAKAAAQPAAAQP